MTQTEYLTDDDQILIVYNDNETRCYFLYNDRRILLAEINNKNKITIIYPHNTRTGSYSFLTPKYKTTFQFEGYHNYIEESHEEKNMYILSGIPEVFIKTLRYGLGLKKEYRFIAELASYLKGCNSIIISKHRETEVNEHKFIINDSDLDKIRRGMDRISDLYRNESSTSKELFVYNELLHKYNDKLFQRKKKTTHGDVIYKIVKDIDFNKSISKSGRNSLLEIRNEAEISYLMTIKNEFAKLIEEDHPESVYQKFFEENPLLLTLFIGSPYIHLNNQAYVGGKSFDNKNGQYPDYLYKHKITNNSFIVEIKCPKSKLLDKEPYRKTGVYSPSSELSGAISQVLTQKYQLETNIATLMLNSENRNIEAYNVQGFIIIGLLNGLIEDDEKAKKRSFELFRHNQKDLKIMTYDECQEQLNCFLQEMDKNNQ